MQYTNAINPALVARLVNCLDFCIYPSSYKDIDHSLGNYFSSVKLNYVMVLICNDYNVWKINYYLDMWSACAYKAHILLGQIEWVKVILKADRNDFCFLTKDRNHFYFWQLTGWTNNCMTVWYLTADHDTWDQILLAWIFLTVGRMRFYF